MVQSSLTYSTSYVAWWYKPVREAAAVRSPSTPALAGSAESCQVPMPLSVPASTLRLLYLQHPKPHVARQRARASARRRGAVCGSTRERTPPPPTPESSARLLQLSRTLTRFCPCGCGAKTPLPHTRTVSTTGRAVLLAASEEHPSTPSTKEKQQAETTDTDNTEQPEEVQKAL